MKFIKKTEKKRKNYVIKGKKTKQMNITQTM